MDLLESLIILPNGSYQSHFNQRDLQDRRAVVLNGIITSSQAVLEDGEVSEHLKNTNFSYNDSTPRANVNLLLPYGSGFSDVHDLSTQYQSPTLPKHKKKRKKKKKITKPDDGEQQVSSSPMPLAQTLDNGCKTDEPSTKKRRRPIYHPDNPTSAAKRSKIDYDEHSSSTNSQGQNVDSTCFFWYHGDCKRNPTTHNSRKCNSGMLHNLTNPPSVVQPPPGYVHREPCGLEWCPGDSKDQPSTKKHRSMEAKKQVDQPKAVPVPRGTADAKQVCFFWYHGHCGRSHEPKRNFKCNLRHALNDPPGMVQPPRGYVHKQPCNLEWCPGDAKEKVTNPKRWFEGDIKSNTSSTNADDNESCPSVGQDGEKEDWFLDGFNFE